MPSPLTPELFWVLLGFVLGSVPQRRTADVGVAFVSKKIGVSPADIQAYAQATAQNDESESS